MNIETKEIFNNTFVKYLPICDKCPYKEFEKMRTWMGK